MAAFPDITIEKTSLDAIAGAEGTVVVFVPAAGTLDRSARRVDRLTRGVLSRLIAGEAFEKAPAGAVLPLDMPSGMAADRLLVVKLERRADRLAHRNAGGGIGAKLMGGKPLRLEAGSVKHPEELVQGIDLRCYRFGRHKTEEAAPVAPESIALAVGKPVGLDAAVQACRAVAAGVHLARDLTAEPSNILTTVEFANRAQALSELGVTVSILDEAELKSLGLNLLLAVGEGSEAPSKVAIMEWQNGGPETPVALVGKGVVFDTGGISLKPAGGMEEMTMDMGGAAVVVGTMHALAARKAKAHVVGLIGLVENMPGGRAQRPGDVVTSLKGDTVEVINTDAEGRLVLADVLWLAQERYAPSHIVDLATLTGAIIIALGHHMCGTFANDDDFAEAFLKAAAAEGEAAWRMPLGTPYAKELDSKVADLANVGGRPGGAINAAEFLQRFIKDGTPWIHLDIAGVAKVKKASAVAPGGVTGWGVATLDRLIRDLHEG